MIEGRELRITAFHEAGHCVCAVVLGLRFLSPGVSLAWGDEDDYGNTFIIPPLADTQDGTLKYLTYLLSGGVTERILAGDMKLLVPGATADIELAKKTLNTVTDEKRKSELRQLCYENAEKLLRANWCVVEAFAKVLIERRSIRGNEVESIVKKLIRNQR